MTVGELWRVLSPAIEIEVCSGGIELASDLPFYLKSDLLDREISCVTAVKKNKIKLEVY